VGTEQQISPRPAVSARNGGATSGWDPYEVWRTRVLVSELTGRAPDRVSGTPAVATFRPVVPAVRTHAEPANGSEWSEAAVGRANDEDLERELINAISSLCLAGLTGVFLTYVDRRPPYARKSRLPITRA